MAKRLSSGFLAFLLPYLILGGAASPVFAGTAHYRAQPAAAASQGTVAARDLVWRCGPADCVAPASNSRPAIVCARLVREVGVLQGFSAGGAALSAAQLEKCNAAAR